MSALTRDRATPYREGIEVEYPVAANMKIYAGSLVCVNAAGYAVPAADTSGYRFAGVALEQVDNSDGGKNVRVRRAGVFEFDPDGRIRAWRDYYDWADLERQLLAAGVDMSGA